MLGADTDREVAEYVWGLSRTQNRKADSPRRSSSSFPLCLVATTVGVVWAYLPRG